MGPHMLKSISPSSPSSRGLLDRYGSSPVTELEGEPNGGANWGRARLFSPDRKQRSTCFEAEALEQPRPQKGKDRWSAR